MELSEIRAKIDTVDDQLLKLFLERMELAEAVALGITDGTNPMQLIPRYQAAIMAKRAAQR